MALAKWERTITDKQGNVMPRAWIDVRIETGSVIDVTGMPRASLFTDRDGLVPLGNPFQADADGNAIFYAAGAAHRVEVTPFDGSGIPRILRFEAVGRGAETDFFFVNPKGAWSAVATYALTDMVYKSGYVFVSMQDGNLNHAPDDVGTPGDTAWWMYMGTAVPGPSGVGDQFDVPVYVQMYPRSGEVFPRFVFTGTTAFPAGLTQSRAKATVASTATAVVSLRKNGVEFGTLTFSAGIQTGVFASAGGATFSAGDEFTMVWPSPRDATLYDVAVTLHGTRS